MADVCAAAFARLAFSPGNPHTTRTAVEIHLTDFDAAIYVGVPLIEDTSAHRAFNLSCLLFTHTARLNKTGMLVKSGESGPRPVNLPFLPNLLQKRAAGK